MALTITSIAQTLITRLGGKMSLAGVPISLVVSTTDPTVPPTPPDPGVANPYTLDAITYAASILNLASSVGTVMDSDLSGVTSNQAYRVFTDLATLQLLRTVANNLTQLQLSATTQDVSVTYADALKDTQNQIEDMEKLYAAQLRTVPVVAGSGPILWHPPTARPTSFRPGYGRPRFGPWGSGYGGW